MYIMLAYAVNLCPFNIYYENGNRFGEKTAHTACHVYAAAHPRQ